MKCRIKVFEEKKLKTQKTSTKTPRTMAAVVSGENDSETETNVSKE